MLDGPKQGLVSGEKKKKKKARSEGDGAAAKRPRAGSKLDSRQPFGELEPRLLEVTLGTLSAHGFTHATPVQEAVIPQLLSRKDVVVQACTGSGKTLAFLVPLYEILARRAEPLKPRQVGAIIIEPTRELATQVCTVAAMFAGRYAAELAVLPLVGGSRLETDRDALRAHGCHVVVGTPGRIEHSLELLHAELRVNELELLVLDEADRLLDMGFEATLNAILRRLPKQRRTGLFSATQTEQVLELIRAGLRNPVKVDVQVVPLSQGKQPTPASLTNWYAIHELEHKLGALVAFLAAHASQRVIVYLLTCAAVDYLGQLLPRLPALSHVPIGALHGKMSSAKRTGAFAWYRERCAAPPSAPAADGKAAGAVLLCTDVAARGLDIPEVEWIVQYDAPQDPDTYVHRVGRTARMGRVGSSLLFVAPEEETFVHFLQVRRVPLQPWPDAAAGAAGGGAAVAGPLAIADAKRVIVEDRDLLDKAVRAFVAHVRAYREHQLKYVFEFKTLNLGALATSYALLKMPRMSELRARGGDGEALAAHLARFVPGMASGAAGAGACLGGGAGPPPGGEEEVDIDAIGYRDHAREKRRLELLASKRAKNEAADAAEAEAARLGAPARDKLGEREARRLRRKAERNAKAAAKHAASRGLGAGGAGAGAAKGGGDGGGGGDDDDDDFADEARMLKRFKQGKISAQQLDAALGMGEEEEAEEAEEGGAASSGRGGNENGGGVAAVAQPAAVDPERARRAELARQKRKRLAALRAGGPLPNRQTGGGAVPRRGGIR